MEIRSDPEFAKQLLEIIAQREFRERVGIHSTDLVYCLNKQYLRKACPKESTAEEVLHYSLGWSTQRWLTGSFEPETEFEVDGITVTPDTLVALGVTEGLAIPWELKATYQSSNKPIIENLHWVRQICSQCYVTGTTTAKLSRLEICGNWKSIFGKKEEKNLPENSKPTLSAWELVFTQEEVDRNWEWMKQRRDQYLEIQRTGVLLPRSIAVAEGQAWECGFCVYDGGECP